MLLVVEEVPLQVEVVVGVHLLVAGVGEVPLILEVVVEVEVQHQVVGVEEALLQ